MKPIFTNLAPNTEWNDVWMALRLLVQPWRWSRGEATAQLENIFREWLPAKYAYAFVSGRTGLYAILKALDLKSSDEVLLQAYTCVAVPDPILWVGAKPVYVDCEEKTFNMSPADLERKITPRSKALIIQHTFGLPANLDALLAIAKKHQLFVIEDCAHALGATYQGEKVGTFGEAAFFSFGRDKVISSVFGGIAVTNNNAIARQLKELQDKWEYPSRCWIMQQLLHPVITTKAKFFWRIGLGRFILAFSKAFHLLSKPVYPREKRGGKPRFVEHRLPNALAELTLRQFRKLEKLNEHRRKIAELYNEKFHKTSQSPLVLEREKILNPPLKIRGDSGSYDNGHIYLRYTIRTYKAAQLLKEAKRRNIFLGDWYREPIAPKGVDYRAIHYTPGSCQVAETLAHESVNLPTDIHIKGEEVERIVEVVNLFSPSVGGAD